MSETSEKCHIQEAVSNSSEKLQVKYLVRNWTFSVWCIPTLSFEYIQVLLGTCFMLF